jgi:hypothetical protein
MTTILRTTADAEEHLSRVGLANPMVFDKDAAR